MSKSHPHFESIDFEKRLAGQDLRFGLVSRKEDVKLLQAVNEEWGASIFACPTMRYAVQV